MFTLADSIVFDIHSAKSFLCNDHDEDLDVPAPPHRAWSPALSDSSAQSSSDEAIEYGDDMQDDAQAPPLYNLPVNDHYEFWDARPSERFCMTGSLYLASDRWSPRPGVQLEFSHMELEVRTHGRQGRFSRENIWRPSYVDFASTPVSAIAAQHLTRTRERSGITFARLDNSYSDAVRIAYKIEIPQELFIAMRTRSLRITSRAIFTEWSGNAVVSAEVVEAEPVCVTVSHLQMRDFSEKDWRNPQTSTRYTFRL